MHRDVNPVTTKSLSSSFEDKKEGIVIGMNEYHDSRLKKGSVILPRPLSCDCWKGPNARACPATAWRVMRWLFGLRSACLPAFRLRCHTHVSHTDPVLHTSMPLGICRYKTMYSQRVSYWLHVTECWIVRMFPLHFSSISSTDHFNFKIQPTILSFGLSFDNWTHQAIANYSVSNATNTPNKNASIRHIHWNSSHSSHHRLRFRSACASTTEFSSRQLCRAHSQGRED